MKRIMFLLCFVFMASGCVPKAGHFSSEQKKMQIKEDPATQRKAGENSYVLQVTGSRRAKIRQVVADQIAGQEADKLRDQAHAECLVKAHTSFAVMLADIISIVSGEVLWGDLASKLATATLNQATFPDPLRLRTTKEVVNTCLKSKGFPPDEENDGSEPRVSSPKPTPGSSKSTPGNPILKVK